MGDSKLKELRGFEQRDYNKWRRRFGNKEDEIAKFGRY